MQKYFIPQNLGSNVYSQYGEDGILGRIIDYLDLKVASLCEFGAWDGKHFSNTFNLGSGERTVFMIEGDERKYQDLLTTAEEFKFIRPVLRFVEQSGANALDAILNDVGCDALDLLSIDIDGNDLNIWKSLSRRPKLVVIEYNPTFGVFKEFTGSSLHCTGNSFSSINNFAMSIGYSLVSYTKTNLIFVAREYLSAKGYSWLDLEVLSILIDIDEATYMIASSYDGRCVEFGRPTNPWDGARLAKTFRYPKWAYGWPPSRLQVAYRALISRSWPEIIQGINKMNKRGWAGF